MRSNYKRLGDYIREVKVRNTDLTATELLGVNIDKFFMPSVANIVGTDMSVYKIVKCGQFACNRMHVGRDMRLPVALSDKDYEFMVSPAYDVFEIKDTAKLLPEYLMMWFTRKEFDREACFYTDADVRGGLNWKALCDMQLPVPSPEKQRQLVNEYHVLVDRINLNNSLIQKLEETAQALYKQWFVDFEFPDANGKPYKSNGGEMVESEMGMIPKGWKILYLNSVCDVINGRAYAEDEFRPSGTPIIRIQNLNGGDNYVYSDFKLDKDKYVEKDDLIFAWSATFGPFIWRGEKSIYHYHIWKLICKNENYKFLLYHYLLRETRRVSGEGSGSIFAHITKSLIESQTLIVGDKHVINSFHKISLSIDKTIENFLFELESLKKLKDLLLSKLATIEN